MCAAPKRAATYKLLALSIALVALLVVLASCGGQEGSYTDNTGKVCLPMPVPVTDMRRECHAIGNDACAYMTTEQYTYNAVGYDCK